MSERFGGPCIGGARDGQWLASPSRYLEIRVLDHLPARPINFGGEPPADFVDYVKLFRYRWFEVLSVGFWVPDEIRPPDPQQVMQRLVNGYGRPAIVEAQP